MFSFDVLLDLASAPVDDDDHVDLASVSFKGLKSMIIDDNVTALEIIRDALVREGMEVTTFTSGQAAFEHLKAAAEAPDLLLVDWKMPDMDGLETIRTFQRDSVLKQSSVIVMVTAYDRYEVLGSAKELGVKRVLTKPITPSHLHDLLMELFGASRAKPKPKRRERVSDKELVKGIEGARILLVEDNDVNQLVASRILSNAGFSVTVAADGQKAVDIVSLQTFDLVLMDVQMPVMDGLTATRVIRGMGFRDLPIVAMTAHAMSNDKLLSLEAGMNDHVNKPINVAELFATMVKWIPKKPGSDDGQGSSLESKPKESGSPDSESQDLSSLEPKPQGLNPLDLNLQDLNPPEPGNSESEDAQKPGPKFASSESAEPGADETGAPRAGEAL